MQSQRDILYIRFSLTKWVLGEIPFPTDWLVGDNKLSRIATIWLVIRAICIWVNIGADRFSSNLRPIEYNRSSTYLTGAGIIGHQLNWVGYRWGSNQWKTCRHLPVPSFLVQAEWAAESSTMVVRTLSAVHARTCTIARIFAREPRARYRSRTK